MVAANCGETATGGEGFCGTSQASPHVAGMAALVRQRFPSYSPAQVVSYLKDHAEQRISSPDPNNDWGHGFFVLPPVTPLPQPQVTVPAAPSLTSVTPGTDSLTVVWRAPLQTGGADITAYDLRHIRSDAPSTADRNWTVVSRAGTGSGALSRTLTGLTSGASYDVQVRAVNDAGEGPWSATASGTPSSPVSVPGAPIFVSVRPGEGSLSVVWNPPPSDGGAPLTAWKVRHIRSDAPNRSDANWTVVRLLPSVTGRLEYLINDLAGQIRYNVQVRAVNAIGEGPWSATASGTPVVQPVCENSNVVPNASSNPQLVADCETLLALKDTLRGTGALNWSGSIRIQSWNGVRIGGSPLRVTEFRIQDNMTGQIPPELGNLTGLILLDLSYNQLTGSIPSAIGNLPNLEFLYLHGNRLTGAIPGELGNLSRLEILYLWSNQLTGTIPARLSGAANLRELSFSDNRLQGSIPAALGRMTNLTTLAMARNELTGSIPEELEDLANLRTLQLSGNQLTGCIPTALKQVPENDVAALGLSDCGEAPAPDLVVDRPTVSTSTSAAGESFTLNATVRNQGNAASSFTTLRYYQSTDSAIPASDTEVGTDSVSRINASASGSEFISVTAPDSAGTYYYGACVDALSDESDTTNNCSSAVAVTVGSAPAPDLVVDRPTVSESATEAGARFTLSATVRNQGNGSSDSTTLRYYQSGDSSITSGDAEVGTDSVSRLDASASGAESISLTAPSTPGTYYYGACVDSVSDESGTMNNCSLAVPVTVAAAPVAPPNQRYTWQGSATVVSWDPVPNAGYYKVYYDDFFDSNCRLSGGSPSFCEEVEGNVRGTSYTHADPDDDQNYYWITACNDAGCSAIDSGNPAQREGAAPAPDLSVDRPTVSESALGAGDRFTLNATVRNQGNGASAFTTLRYYRSSDPSITSSDSTVGTDSVSRLNASANSAESISLDAPDTPGTYYYGACVDTVSDETDTTNNCSVAITVTVGAAPAPDLVVDAPTVSESAPAAGASFTLSATVRNQGNASSAFTTLRYYQSTDSTITASDTEVGTDSVSRLVALETGDESISLTAPDTPGTYYYGACVDSVSDESDAINNCSVAVTVTVGAAPAPDLVVDTPAVSESAPTAGDRFTLNATVRNQGNASSAFTTLRYYQSTDQTITTGDTSIDTDYVSRLDASASGAESISLTAPSTPGTYYYGACVDSVSDESDTMNNCSLAVPVTVAAALVAPSNQRYTWQGSATVVSWDPVPDAGYYKVYYDDFFGSSCRLSGGSPSFCEEVAGNVSGTSYTHADPDNDRNYYWIAACNDAGCSAIDSGNPAQREGAAPAPDLVVDPPTVSERAPAAGERFTLSATVRNQSNDASAFTTLRYYRSTDSAITTNDTEVGTDSVSRLDATESSDESISPNAPSTPGTYYYGACVDSVSDESDTTNNCSAAVTVTVGDVGTAPGAPTGLSATADGQTEIDLSWTAPSDNGGADITGYRIEASTNGSNWNNLVADTGSTSTSYSHTGLTAGSTRHYRVSAINSAGMGPASNTANATTVTQAGTSPCATGSAVPDAANNPGLVDDCETLLAAEDTLRGTANLNWSANTPISQWNGITVGGTPLRATKLSLSRNLVTGRLTGMIPPELANLANLKTLDLSENRLTGRIPPELANLTNLTTLDLWDNQLTGSIPVQLGDLSNLRFLILNNNQLSGGIPAELGEFGKLEILNLRHNQLSGAIPSEFSGLTSLTRLDLLDNQLTGSIPSELGSIRSLERLELNGNQLTGRIPPELGNIANLTQLELNHNRLSGEIPAELGNLTNLTTLNLHNNRLTGSIPPELGRLAQLQRLNLAGNQLSGCIPPGLLTVQFNDFASLGLLDCAEDPPTDVACATGGAVVNAASNPGLVSDCDALIVARVTLRGTTTLNWSHSTAMENWEGVTLGGVPKRVTKLSIPQRGLLGTIPPELGDLSNLTELILSGNNLTGAIPPELGSLASLERLLLPNNNLTGEIPPLLGNVANLTSLWLNSNQLSGEIPTEFGNLANLRELNLGWNRLSGNIPSELGNLSKLERLTLTVNRLSGCVPAALKGRLRSYLFDRHIDFCSPSTAPGAPTGLTATADGQTEIDLSWSAPSDDGGADITGYRIEVSTNGSSWSNLVADTNSTSTSYSHTGLTAGSTRHYRVSAINSEGTGPASGTDSANTDEESNSAPTAVGTIPDQVITQGIELKVDVSPYFNDPDDDALSYSIWSPRLFNAESVSGSTAALLLTSLFICDPTTVTITAQDPGGLEATQDFTLRRFNNPPVASSGTFPSQTIDVGETVPLYMGNWFSDPGYLRFDAEIFCGVLGSPGR